jgi:hypothetical protein
MQKSLPILLFLSSGCAPSSIEYITQSVPVFSLEDVNPNSETYETTISSDQFSNTSPKMVSAWYFGHST